MFNGRGLVFDHSVLNLQEACVQPHVRSSEERVHLSGSRGLKYVWLLSDKFQWSSWQLSLFRENNAILSGLAVANKATPMVSGHFAHENQEGDPEWSSRSANICGPLSGKTKSYLPSLTYRDELPETL